MTDEQYIVTANVRVMYRQCFPYLLLTAMTTEIDALCSRLTANSTRRNVNVSIDSGRVKL